MTGSHIDTVIQAGQFDGALGVLGGIEVLRTIKEQSIRHDRPFEVICFTDEEGVRFGAAIWEAVRWQILGMKSGWILLILPACRFAKR